MDCINELRNFIFKLFFISGGQSYLSMDRANWRWGHSNINILTLGIVLSILFNMPVSMRSAGIGIN